MSYMYELKGEKGYRPNLIRIIGIVNTLSKTIKDH